MGLQLIVAEKPSVARDIARVLGAKERGQGFLRGGEYVVTWALGHLVALQEPEEIDARYKRWRREDLPILPQTLPLKVLPKTKAQYMVIKKWMRDSEITGVINATDAGREGELIFRYIYQMALCKKPVRRLWIASLTDEAIREGFQNLAPAAKYDPLYHSARARNQADWLVGMNATRAFTLRYGPLLSVGRVQTPTLSMLVKRRKEIEAFVPTPYFQVEAGFGDYKGLYCLPGEQTAARLPKEEDAKAISDQVRGQTGRVAEITREAKRDLPPQLYDLTTLQREANSRLGFTAQRTLKAAQSLYEQYKLITYPRTDSRYLPKDMAPKVQKTMAGLPPPLDRWAGPLSAKGLPLPPRIYDDGKVSDHHAILPTGKSTDLAKLPPDEAKLYEMVARRLVAAFSEPFLYDAVRIYTEVEKHRFLTTGRLIRQQGWREVERPKDEKAEKDDEDESSLPQLAEGESRKVQRVLVKSKKTEPPKPYTDASLLYAMEHAGREVEDEALREEMRRSGLGTPATRAAILERLVEVGYAKRQGRAWIATDKGVQLIEAAPADIASPETTGRWEKALGDITKGQGDEARFMEGIRRMAAYLVEYALDKAPEIPFAPEEKRGKYSKSRTPKVKSRGLPCPLCGKGEVTETDKAFGCSRWKAGCAFTIWKNSLERAGGPQLDWTIVEKALKEGRVQGSTGQVILEQGKIRFEKKA